MLFRAICIYSDSFVLLHTTPYATQHTTIYTIMYYYYTFTNAIVQNIAYPAEYATTDATVMCHYYTYYHMVDRVEAVKHCQAGTLLRVQTSMQLSNVCKVVVVPMSKVTNV